MNCHIHLIKKALHSPDSEPIKRIGAAAAAAAARLADDSARHNKGMCGVFCQSNSLQEAVEGGRN